MNYQELVSEGGALHSLSFYKSSFFAAGIRGKNII